MRPWPVVFVFACSSSPSGPPVRITTTWDVTEFGGHGPSPLDPLQGQTISVEVELVDVNSQNDDPAMGPAGCKSRTFWDTSAKRTATGVTADLVQSQVLDMLPDWEVTLQICTPASSSSLLVVATIDALNLDFGCPVPANALVTDSMGFPELSTFSTSGCNSTILDVSNNRSLGNPSFALDVRTAKPVLP